MAQNADMPGEAISPSGQTADAARARWQAAGTKNHSDVPFFVGMGLSSSLFVLLILALIIADLMFVTTEDFRRELFKPEIRFAISLTLQSCTLAALLSLLVAIPLGYLLSRFRFPLASVVDTIVEVPVVLPPLVLGLSLLILFNTPLGGWLSGDSSWKLETWLRNHGFPVTYHWRAVVLAQFSVACAFAVRTMRVTFDQIPARAEDVARTLGCSRATAFFRVALPQAWRGVIAAGTIAWARSLGEFGPIMVFAGATRMKTEVLSTSVFLELSVGNLNAAVAVSLLMVFIALLVLTILRVVSSRQFSRS